jgi:hypothetical protein
MSSPGSIFLTFRIGVCPWVPDAHISICRVQSVAFSPNSVSIISSGVAFAENPAIDDDGNDQIIRWMNTTPGKSFTSLTKISVVIGFIFLRAHHFATELRG